MLLNATASVRAQVRSCGICGGQSNTGANFFRVLWFPLPIPPTAPHSSSIIRGWYNGQISGLRTKLTQSHPTPRNNKKILYFDYSNFVTLPAQQPSWLRCVVVLSTVNWKFRNLPWNLPRLSSHVICTALGNFLISWFAVQKYRGS
jgi:hypothetical protein